ncbi:MAG: hypothetical protein WKG00_34885 [Polyangiaceae bacterium]
MDIKMAPQRVQLVSAIPATDLWEDLTTWRPTTGILGVQGVLVLAEKLNNFRVRIGIQTAASDVEIANAPLAPTDAGGTGLGYVTTITKAFYRFDCTVTTAGRINDFAYFRIGVLYSSTDTVFSRGDVVLYCTYKM